MKSEAAQQKALSLYEAVFDDAAWEDWIKDVGEAIGGGALGLNHRSEPASIDPIDVQNGRVDDSVLDYCREHFPDAAQNPAIGALFRNKLGEPFELSSFLPEGGLTRIESVRSFFGPHDFDKALYVSFARGEASLSFMIAARARGERAFEKEDHDFFRFIAPHLKGALRLRDLRISRLRQDQAREQILANGAHGAVGLIFMSSDRRLVDADALGAQLIEGGTLFDLRRGRLHPARQLAAADADKLARLAGARQGPVGPLSVVLDLGSAVRITAYPVSQSFGAGLTQLTPMVALAVEPFSNGRDVDLAAFSGAYGLSDGETRLLDALTKEATASDAARALGVSRNTAKTHLASIFQKTRTRSQQQLMLLLGAFR